MQTIKLLNQLDDLLEHKKYILDSCNKMSKYLFAHGKEELAYKLIERAVEHDNSKIEQEEINSFLNICDSNKSLTNPKYTMTDYDKKCIAIHWKHNRHHPEHFENITDMGELDLIEMVCDWYARSKQLKTNFMEFVFERQKNRFNFPDDMFETVLKYSYILRDNDREVESDMKREKREFVFFHSPKDDNSYLSNWYYSDFTVDGVKFTSAEQFMMYSKAKLFKDDKIAKQIMNTDDFGEIKALGRKVKNFNDDVWNAHKEKIMFTGLLEKFRQNTNLKQELLGTKDAILAECAVHDKVWGIGLSLHDSRRFDMSKWEGQSLLGKILMDVRECLKLEEMYR